MNRLKFAAALLKSKLGQWVAGDHDAPVRRDLARAHGQIRRHTDQLRSRLEVVGQVAAVAQIDEYHDVNASLEAVLARQFDQDHITAERCRGLSLSVQAGIAENLETGLNLGSGSATAEEVQHKAELLRNRNERAIDALRDAIAALGDSSAEDQDAWESEEAVVVALEQAIAEVHQIQESDS